MRDEALAGIKLLVALAKADGVLHDNESTAIKNALEGADLGADVTIEELLEQPLDVDVEIAKIASNEGRLRAFEAACAMVYVDGDADETERVILDKMRTAWEVQKPKSAAERMTGALKQDWLPSTITPIDDPVKRDAEIDKLVVRACVRAAIFGAIPVPFVGEFLVSFVGIQTLQSIGALYGHTGDGSFWKAFTGNFVGATAARVAVLSLVKLVPGWGSVVGASGAYASTWAMARATRLYFEKGQSMDPAALRETFKTAKKEGEQKAKEAASEIAAEQERSSLAKVKLDDDLSAGRISEEQYAAEIVKT